MESKYQDYIVPAFIGIGVLVLAKGFNNVVDTVTTPFKDTDPKTTSEKEKQSSNFKNLYTAKPEDNPFNPNFFTANKSNISALCKKAGKSVYYAISQAQAVNYAKRYHDLTTGLFSKFTTTQDNILDVFGRCKCKLDIYAVAMQYANLYKQNLYNQVNLTLNDTNKARLNAYIESLLLIVFTNTNTYPLYK